MPVLDWIGKDAVAGSHRRAPYHLVHCNGNLSAGDVRSSNLLIHGDNLLALKAILPYYRGRVKCVYIDPPYNTGNEDWVYNDNVDSPVIRRWLGKTVGDKAADLARDDKWLCMMHPRLSLLRQFLRPDGAIFVSIDDNEIHHLRILMDQIFGPRNHVASFVWEGVRKNNPKFAAISHDYVVCYARKIDALKTGGKWRVGKEGLPPIFAKAQELKFVHGDDYAKISEGMKEWFASLEKKDPSFQHRHYCDVDEGGVYFSSDISAPGGDGPKYAVLHPRTGKPVRVPSRGWGISKKEKMEEAVRDGRVLFGEDESKVPTYKRYLHETSEQTLAGVFYQDRRAAMQKLRGMLGGKKFDFPKDVGILKKFIGVMTAGNDLVMDTFAGSGTTGQAVLELNREDKGNRQFILVEMEDDLCREVAARRLSHVVGEHNRGNEKNAEGTGVGFRYCELGKSLFNEKGDGGGEIPRPRRPHFLFGDWGSNSEKGGRQVAVAGRIRQQGDLPAVQRRPGRQAGIRRKHPHRPGFGASAEAPPQERRSDSVRRRRRPEPGRTRGGKRGFLSNPLQGESVMNLHDYQRECLDALVAYFERAAADGTQRAFQEIVGRPYRPIDGFSPEMPYVCVKVPTGGGKTLIAAHAVGQTAAAHMESDSPTVLWLAPTGAIVDQTLKALAGPHSCRDALEDSFPGRVNTLSLDEAYSLSGDDLANCATIIVATVQSLRAEDTDDRKIYSDAGGLMEHFATTEADAGLDEDGEKSGEGFYSLANVLKMRRPMVIVDEAHNARTGLSFKSLARFNPSCIVEFTATPQTRTAGDNIASNVLCQVSAARLKKANMIKAPLKMRVNDDGFTAVENAVAKQRELEEIAKAEERETGEYIRPIVLFQAGKAGSDFNVDRLRGMLLEIDGITEEQIAVSIGERDELKDANLMARGPLRFIITVQKLGEGWDCPFAYVLCSVANIGAIRTVEQILGRVLRLPNAQAKSRPELNEAHAFVAHQNFLEAAEHVQKALVEGAGFNALEARDFVSGGADGQGGLFDEAASPASGVKLAPLSVPRLGIRDGKQLILLSQNEFLDMEWELAKSDADLPRFRTDIQEGRVVIDVNERGNIYMAKFASDLRRDMALLAGESEWTLENLVGFVDRNFEHPDVPFAQSTAFIHKAVSMLLDNRKMELPELVRHRVRLAEAVKRRVEDHRRAMRRRGLQGILDGMGAARSLETSPDLALTIRGVDYAPNWFCENSAIFTRHVFPGRVGELKASGEEFRCAFHLDQMPETDAWLRNLERRRATSFWLPTATDLFYPDFIVRLKDGRILVVEYKGEQFWTTDDSKEKRALGELWADKSGGGCLFVMVNENLDGGFRAINNAVAQKPSAKKRQ